VVWSRVVIVALLALGLTDQLLEILPVKVLNLGGVFVGFASDGSYPSGHAICGAYNGRFGLVVTCGTGWEVVPMLPEGASRVRPLQGHSRHLGGGPGFTQPVALASMHCLYSRARML
jgi:hypothetical protein